MMCPTYHWVEWKLPLVSAYQNGREEDSPQKLTYFFSLAVIVSCLASFRALYTHKERLNRAQFQDRTTRKPTFHQSKGHRIPLEGTGDTCAFVNAYHEARILREESSRTPSEDMILPLNSIHVRHDFAVLPEPMDVYRPV